MIFHFQLHTMVAKQDYFEGGLTMKANSHHWNTNRNAFSRPYLIVKPNNRDFDLARRGDMLMGRYINLFPLLYRF